MTRREEREICSVSGRVGTCVPIKCFVFLRVLMFPQTKSWETSGPGCSRAN